MQKLQRILPLLVTIAMTAAPFLSVARASALPPPMVQLDFDRIYIAENFRDDGRVIQVKCATIGSTDPGVNAQAVWQFFADKLPAHLIAAIIGNMQIESGVQPQRLEGTASGGATPAEELTDVQKNNSYDTGGRGWGIVQWTPAGKFVNTFDTISDANLLINQLNFLWDQLEGRGPIPEKAAGDALKAVAGPGLGGSADTSEAQIAAAIETATRVFAEQYERPSAEALYGDPSLGPNDPRREGSMNARIAAANGAYSRFASTINTVSDPVNAPIDGAVEEFPAQAALTPAISSCQASSDGDGSVAAVAQEQALTGGGNFLRDVSQLGVSNPNSADFATWSLLQSGNPVPGGVDGWRYSSVDALQDVYSNNTAGLQFIPAGSGAPQINDLAFFNDEEAGIEYVGIVIAVNQSGDIMTIIYLDSDGNIKQEDRSTTPGADGLVGYGRAAPQHLPPLGSGGDNGGVAGLNNPGGLSMDCNGSDSARFTAADIQILAQQEINGTSNCFMENAPRPDNGPGAGGQGQFRLICTASHFAYDDPIIYPGQVGRSHLHMFWGNTLANANTTPGSLLNSGASTCQGGPLNRSAYWAPAMISGYGASAHVVVPKVITLYYKSYRPYEANTLPLGIQLLIGNVSPGGRVGTSFSAGQSLSWGCYNPAQGMAVNLTNTIPGTNGTPRCPNGWDIQASIQFPQCFAMSGGRPVLTSPDYVSHTLRIPNNNPCPSSHPYRTPQISYLMKWKNPGGSESTWRLSSDAGYDQANVPSPGGSLHGDWLGGWNDTTINFWHQNCIRNVRNCSLGQTGTNRQFQRIRGANMDGGLMEYDGPQLIPIGGATTYSPNEQNDSLLSAVISSASTTALIDMGDYNGGGTQE